MDGTVYVRVSSLEKLVKDLKHDHLDVAMISIDNPDPGDPDFTDSLYVTGVNSSDTFLSIDMDDIVSDDSLRDLFHQS